MTKRGDGDMWETDELDELDELADEYRGRRSGRRRPRKIAAAGRRRGPPPWPAPPFWRTRPRWPGGGPVLAEPWPAPFEPPPHRCCPCPPEEALPAGSGGAGGAGGAGGDDDPEEPAAELDIWGAVPSAYRDVVEKAARAIWARAQAAGRRLPSFRTGPP